MGNENSEILTSAHLLQSVEKRTVDTTDDPCSRPSY